MKISFFLLLNFLCFTSFTQAVDNCLDSGKTPAQAAAESASKYVPKFQPSDIQAGSVAQVDGMQDIYTFFAYTKSSSHAFHGWVQCSDQHHKYFCSSHSGPVTASSSPAGHAGSGWQPVADLINQLFPMPFKVEEEHLFGLGKYSSPSEEDVIQAYGRSPVIDEDGHLTMYFYTYIDIYDYQGKSDQIKGFTRVPIKFY